MSIPDPQVEVLPIEGWVMLSSCWGVLLLRREDAKAARISFVFILSRTYAVGLLNVDDHE